MTGNKPTVGFALIYDKTPILPSECLDVDNSLGAAQIGCAGLPYICRGPINQYLMKVNSAEYQEHAVFSDLSEYARFYKDLSFSVMLWMNQGTRGAINMDTFIFSSMEGTLESIHDVLKRGRINDAYALLRKFYDSAIINLYANLYLMDNFSIDNFVVRKIERWRQGKEAIPGFREMSDYILKSNRVKEITGLLYVGGGFKGSVFESIRQRCNDHTHYLYFRTLMLNNSNVNLEERLDVLDALRNDLREIFILHLGYLFYLNQHYMMSSDYFDCIEVGERPSEDLQYEVAPFIQRMFDGLVKPYREDIYAAVKAYVEMKLD